MILRTHKDGNSGACTILGVFAYNWAEGSDRKKKELSRIVKWASVTLYFGLKYAKQGTRGRPTVRKKEEERKLPEADKSAEKVLYRWSFEETARLLMDGLMATSR